MGRYARIKSQTNVAISWLVETARVHGNNVRTVPEPGAGSVPSATASAAPSTVPPGRLKGKARKEAKKAQQQQQARASQSGSDTPKKYGVSTEEILRQAQFLKTLGETVAMSESVWNAFKDAV